MVNLTTADIADSAGAHVILDAIRKRWPWIKHLFADGAYDRRKLMDKAAFTDFVLEIVRRIDSEPGFKGAAAPLGGRAHLRLDDALAPPRARLRTAHRCLKGHDPCSPRKPIPQADFPLESILKRTHRGRDDRAKDF